MKVFLCFCFILVAQISVGTLGYTVGYDSKSTPFSSGITRLARRPTSSTDGYDNKYTSTFSSGIASTVPTPSAKHVSLTSNVNLIVSALTRDLELTCTFPPIADTGLSRLITLVVSKKTGSVNEDIAKMDIFQPTVVNKFVDVGAEITGKLDPTGTSFLKFKWLYPEPNNAGVYVCQVNGLRTSGHGAVFETSLKITNKSPDLQTLVEQVRFNSRRQDGIITDLNRLHQVDESRVHTLFDISSATNGTQYLAARMNFQDVNIAEALCGLADGHLADIKDGKEWAEVKAFIQSLPNHSSRFTHTLFSPTDEDHEGTWSYRHNGFSVQKITWATGNPGSSTSSNCAAFRRSNFVTYTVSCKGADNYNFICERVLNP